VETPDQIPVELRDVSIVIFGQPYTGSILPNATEEAFQFRPKGGSDLLTFRWNTLEPSERERIRKLVGLDGGDRPNADTLWGEDVAGVRLKLKGSRNIEGLAQPDRNRPGFRCIRTSSKQVMIPEPDILSEEKVTLKESQVFSPDEAYERLILRRPPKDDSASDHLELARTCLKMSLFDRALYHADHAKAIDPRTEENNKAFYAEVEEKLKAHQAADAYARITMAIQSADYGTALARCDDFLRSFPSDERLTRVQKIREDLEPKKEANLRQVVIRMHYNLVTDLLQQRMGKKIKVDEKGLPVPAIPGKQVTTRHNQVIRGLPVSDDGLKVVLKDAKKDLTIEIPRNDIRRIEEVDLSQGVKMLDPTFEELKAYATGELEDDIIARIAETLRTPPAQVRELWEGRFERTAVVENGILRTPAPLTAQQTACFGEGSWLRNATPGATGASTRRGGAGRIRNIRGNSNTGTGGNAGMSLQNPTQSDDPEIWWSAQSNEAKLGILRAFAGESLFKVRATPGKVCPECSGRGAIDTPGQNEPQPCPICRGLKNLVTVVYE
jgi:tetratricopeptide (TPR) repeat protein